MVLMTHQNLRLGKWWKLYWATSKPTSFPGSLILPPRASEERPWFGLVTCYCDNWEHQGGVLCNQAVCRVELCRAVTSPPSHAMLKSSLRAEILNSVYSDVYLKVRQVFLEAINRGCVRLLSSYPLDLWTVMNCGRRADPDVQTNFIPKW